MRFIWGRLADGDLDRQKSFLSDDADSPDLINGELPDAMSFYYEKGKLYGIKDMGGNS